ncbi:MAG: hypothetical protein M3Y26_04200 [Actinomycetota bacterium]|nr:hypothetical protein [Actinomycetota bacterium]
MRARSIAGTDVASLYGAHRLSLVRLAVLLLPPDQSRAGAEQVVQDAFLQLQRGGGRDDPGAALASLQAVVVAGSRRLARSHSLDRRSRPEPSPTAAPTTIDRVIALPRAQREALVLTLWAARNDRQAAVILGVRESAVTAATHRALATLHTTGPSAPDSAAHDPTLDRTLERVDEALHRWAESVAATDLRTTFADVLAEDARITVTHRRRGLTLVATLVVVALVAAVTTAIGRRTPAATPPPPIEMTAPTEPLSSPALAPDEKPRSAIPWDQVGPGWTVLTTAATAIGITTTVLLAAPNGTRYPISTAADGIVIQDVSRDGHRVLLSVGAQPQEWDLVAGTSRPLGVSYGWKTMRYAGTPDSGYLMLWTDSNAAVQLDHRSRDGRLLATYPFTLPPVAGSPGTPGLAVDRATDTAVVSTIDDQIKLVDLHTDAVATLPPPAGASGCTPRSSWSRGEVLLACRSAGGRLFVSPLDGSAARPVGGAGFSDAWPSPIGTTVLRGGDACSTSLTDIGPDGTVRSATLPPVAAGLVLNTVVDGVASYGGTRCADDGDRLVTEDLGSGRTTVLAGPEAGGRTVRQAVVITAGGG